MTQVGELNKQITIQEPVPARDVYGGDNPTFTTFAIMWAKVRSVDGDEKIALSAVVEGAIKKFTVHYTAGLTPSMRIVYNGATYDVFDIQDDNTTGEAFLTLYAETQDVSS